MPFNVTGQGTYSLDRIQRIVVDTRYAKSFNDKGQSLIPPSLWEFATTFQQDLADSLGIKVQLEEGRILESNSIFITLDPNGTYLDAAERATLEGYSIAVRTHGIQITGASALGSWWGTRTLLQMAIINNKRLAYGAGSDAPGWATRGAMLDCGRHYYPPEFLIEMCSYLSFFKQNEFHVHLSDNLFINYDTYTTAEEWALYKSFRLLSDDPAVAGLNQNENESYTKDQFDSVQRQCASRGVTIIPEIEAPAHALSITTWKPQLALDGDPTLINISHPDALPTMRTIWKTFLPWFHSKTVHIGADEYSADLVADYDRLVNNLQSFIEQESGKQVRIWGTFTPSSGFNVSKDVVIQHWASYDDNPYFDYIKNGWSVINSDYAFYVVTKWSGYFPQRMNKTLIFNGNPMGGAYAPHIFDITNATNNPSRKDPSVVGHVAAQWSDFGPIPSTYLEAYYGWRNELPAMADKQWGGQLIESEYNDVLECLIAKVPGQNLDRRAKSKTNLIFSYQFSESRSHANQIKDSSGNGYTAISHGCSIHSNALHLDGYCYLETPLFSKGRNYSLSFWINPSSSSGVIFSGPDSALLNGEGSNPNVTLVTGNNSYTLNYSLPVNTWTQVALSGLGDFTYLTVLEQNSAFAKQMEFLTIFHPNAVSSARGVMDVWDKIAIEAPLKEIGRGIRGMIKNITLLA
ncbi:uncharacterized protein N7496_008501 [Penicillium cataractarum]|uniref:beta-N-acetylhexosaminidase n=1 Tax=Penicillium cataractarum TaxID=2100454 RepID=A0A9W9V738_9EURO|nr:uncharacterized protein N7496_008501 [Penicillium cataractarum]KAJ5368741.1 hypothetical protein N7496_008501 [Penicillium cataractarum]